MTPPVRTLRKPVTDHLRSTLPSRVMAHGRQARAVAAPCCGAPLATVALAIALALLLREGAVRSGAEGSTMFFTGPAILPEGTTVLGAAWLVFVGAVVATATS